MKSQLCVHISWAPLILWSWCCSFLCWGESGHRFIFIIIIEDGSAGAERVRSNLIYIPTVFCWLLLQFYEPLYLLANPGVTKSLKLYALRWKSKEGCTSNWRLVSFTSLVVLFEPQKCYAITLTRVQSKIRMWLLPIFFSFLALEMNSEWSLFPSAYIST